MSALQQALNGLALQAEWEALRQGLALKKTEQERSQAQQRLTLERAAEAEVSAELRHLLAQGGTLNPHLIAVLRRELAMRASAAARVALDLATLGAQVNALRDELTACSRRAEGLRGEAKRTARRGEVEKAKRSAEIMDELWIQQRGDMPDGH
jgi:hypothetical protein